MGSVIQFASAVLQHWTALLTGSFVALILVLIDKLTDWRLPKWCYVIVVMGTLLVSVFQAWQDERGRAQDAERQIRTLEAAAPKLEVYYRDSELDGKRIVAATGLPPASCTAIQIDPIPSRHDHFELCGLWAKNLGGRATAESLWLYLNFSAEVDKDVVSDCWQRYPSSENGYPVEFRCNLGTPSISPGQRLDLPGFYGTPIPAKDTRIKIRLFYGQKQPAEGAFTWRRPDPNG